MRAGYARLEAEAEGHCNGNGRLSLAADGRRPSFVPSKAKLDDAQIQRRDALLDCVVNHALKNSAISATQRVRKAPSAFSRDIRPERGTCDDSGLLEPPHSTGRQRQAQAVAEEGAEALGQEELAKDQSPEEAAPEPQPTWLWLREFAAGNLLRGSWS